MDMLKDPWKKPNMKTFHFVFIHLKHSLASQPKPSNSQAQKKKKKTLENPYKLHVNM